MNAQLDILWRADNQQLLSAEFARIRALLGNGDLQQARDDIKASRETMQGESSIDTVMHLFGLNGFERDVLLLTAAAELDSEVSELCATAYGQIQRRWVSFGLALSLFDNAHWSAIAPLEPLRHWRLLEIDNSGSLIDARLKVDERVLHFINGLNYLDHRLRSYFRSVKQPSTTMADEHRATTKAISAQLQDDASGMQTIYLAGDDRDSQLDVAIQVAAELGATLHEVHSVSLPESLTDQESLIDLWHRESALLASGLIIIHDADNDACIPSFIEQVQGLVFVIGAAATSNDKGSCTFTVNKPDAPQQRELWQAVLGEQAGIATNDMTYLANQYRLNARRIESYVTQASDDDGKVDTHSLHRLCRGSTEPTHSLARHIESTTGWDDLILPPGQLRTLKQLLSHTQHRMKVHYDWGFAGKTSRGLGIASLFSGESGTGKTMAAEVLANELELSLYRIDLSAVVSKYIGETEKNLKKLFDVAEDTGAVLLFDEADALFGKRSDVKDSHDRYANIEVSYLLQRMEAYRGIAILTSNHRTALDPAFQRRLRFIVDFPFPDATQRESIWRSIFPKATPVENLDFAKLARLNATGGNIRNIALSAAFMAAEANSAVTMSLIQRAAQLEVAKSERTLATAETRGWA